MSGSVDEADDAALAAALEAETAELEALRSTVAEWRLKAGKLRATQRTLEGNIERLFAAGKEMIAERDTAIRQLQQG